MLIPGTVGVGYMAAWTVGRGFGVYITLYKGNHRRDLKGCCTRGLMQIRFEQGPCCWQPQCRMSRGVGSDPKVGPRSFNSRQGRVAVLKGYVWTIWAIWVFPQMLDPKTDPNIRWALLQGLPRWDPQFLETPIWGIGI